MTRRSNSRRAGAALVLGTALGLSAHGCAAEVSDVDAVGVVKSALGTAGGQIFLSGDDADDSGHCNGSACGGLFINLFNEALDSSRTGPQAVPNASKKILTIGVNASQAAVGFN